METPRVVVVGGLLYDLLARPDGGVALRTDTFTRIHAGGSGANAASWLAAWLTGGTSEEVLRRGAGLAARAVERVGGRPDE